MKFLWSTLWLGGLSTDDANDDDVGRHTTDTLWFYRLIGINAKWANKCNVMIVVIGSFDCLIFSLNPLELKSANSRNHLTPFHWKSSHATFISFAIFEHFVCQMSQLLTILDNKAKCIMAFIYYLKIACMLCYMCKAYSCFLNDLYSVTDGKYRLFFCPH